MGGVVRKVLDPLNLFGGSDTKKTEAPPVAMPPPTPPPTPPPVIEDAQVKAEQNAQVKAEQNEDQMRRRQGRAATILSGGGSAAGTGTPSVGTKTLLGQ